MPDSQRVDLDDFALHYWEWPGNPPTLVCLHPSSHYGRIWEWVAERFVLAGHSLGARTGMVYAALHPARVSHLILVGGPHYSTIHPGADVEYWQTNARNTAARPRRRPSADAAVEAVRTQYPHFSQAALEHVVEHNTRPLPDGGLEWKYDPAFVAEGLKHALDDLRPYAARISCPVLILRAEQSWELTPERMPEVESVFCASPSVQTVSIESGVGNLELEKPDQVARAIREWLATTPDRVTASVAAHR